MKTTEITFSFQNLFEESEFFLKKDNNYNWLFYQFIWLERIWINIEWIVVL